MEAVSELNLKQKSMRDLIDNSEFKRSDILVIQVGLVFEYLQYISLQMSFTFFFKDPNDTEKYNINNFYFIKNAVDSDENSEDLLRNLNRSGVNSTANLVIAELEKTCSDVC